MRHTLPVMLTVCLQITATNNVFAHDSLLNFGPQQIVPAHGVDLDVGAHSVPCFVDWNNDNLNDLIIGDGDGKVRIYLNLGTESNPRFEDYSYAQSEGADLYCPPSCCLGCCPGVVYWDADDRKDLLVGQADGTVKIFLNVGTDSDPNFDAGTLLTVGPPGSEQILYVGYRATPDFEDFDNDGAKDLVVGASDGKIHIYINSGPQGGTTPPSFWYSPAWGTLAQENGKDLIVPSRAASKPVVFDLDGDGKKDLITGNAYGQILFYRNLGTHTNPDFSGYSLISSNGVAIDLPGDWSRSRPSVCYWTPDAYPDILLGGLDGKVRLYQGIPKTGDMDANGYINLLDFSLFSIHWQQTNCGQCSGADFTDDENVDINDLREFTANWLTAIN